jgi:molybdate-binding protein
LSRGGTLGITEVKDLARADVRFVNRQNGSGTRTLLSLMLNAADVPCTSITGFHSAEFTHSAVAAYIASGMADVGIGVRTAAQRFNLDFIPLVRERYFFAVSKAAVQEPLMQRMIGILQLPEYHQVVDELPGYDATDTGRILSLDEAFGPLRRTA